jgi:hypothetical protein
MLRGLAVGRPPHYLVVVRRGKTELFEQLKRELAREPYPATLIWYRRQGDRRRAEAPVTVDRRRHDERRADPDASWHTHHFVVASTTSPPIGLSDAYSNPVAVTQTAVNWAFLDRFAAGRPRPGVLAAAMLALRLRATLAEQSRTPTLGHPASPSA